MLHCVSAFNPASLEYCPTEHFPAHSSSFVKPTLLENLPAEQRPAQLSSEGYSRGLVDNHADSDQNGPSIWKGGAATSNEESTSLEFDVCRPGTFQDNSTINFLSATYVIPNDFSGCPYSCPVETITKSTPEYSPRADNDPSKWCSMVPLPACMTDVISCCPFSDETNGTFTMDDVSAHGCKLKHSIRIDFGTEFAVTGKLETTQQQHNHSHIIGPYIDETEGQMRTEPYRHFSVFGRSEGSGAGETHLVLHG